LCLDEQRYRRLFKLSRRPRVLRDEGHTGQL
jgi:hypothetical protein